MSTYIWVAIFAALLIISVLVSFRAGQMKGYKEGARQVLNEWKQYLREGDEIDG